MFLAWISLSIVAAIFAAKCGRNFFGWLILSLLLSPLIAGLLLLILPVNRA